MAYEVSQIETVLTAKTDQHDKALEKSEKKLTDFGKGASDAGFKSWTNKVSGSLTELGTSLSIGLTAPLALIGKKILEIGFSYEKAMNTFQAVTRASADEMSRAAAMAEKLGADMTLPATSAADAALAMTELAKGGFTAAQAMEAARGSLQLAAAAQVSEAEAATITANALNTFHLAAEKSVFVSDLLAAASNASSAEITDIALAMQQAGASAAALGVPIEDLVTAIGEMANAGIKGSDAGTSLKTFMAALTPVTEKAANAMKQLGIDAFDASGKFVGLEQVITQAQPALARMTTEQRAMAIETAFGSDAMRAANIILGEGVGKWNAMSGAVGQSGAASELAAAKTKGLSGAWDGFISQLETAGLKAFKAISSSLEGFVRQAASVVEGISRLDSSVIKMGITMAGVAAVGGPLALVAGKLLSMGKGGALITGVILGVEAIAAAYAINFAEMTNTLDAFAVSIGRAFGGKSQADVGAWSDMMAQLSIIGAQTLDILLTGFAQLASLIGGVVRANIAIYKGDFVGAFNAIKEGFSGVADAGDKFNSRLEERQKQMQIVLKSGSAGLMEYMRLQNKSGGEISANAFFQGYEQNNPIPQIKKKAVGELGGFFSEMEKMSIAGGFKFGQGLKQGAYQATHQSPFFIIHWLQDAAKYAQNEAPTEFAKAGTKMGEKLKAGFQAALGNINEFLGRAIGGTGTISDSVFDVMLRKFPQVAVELGKQATAFRETNKAIELYSALMTTAEGRNTEFAQTVRINIQKLLDFDKALRSEITPTFANLGGEIQSTTIITKEFGEAIAKSIGSLVEASVLTLEKFKSGFKNSSTAAAEWGKVMTDAVRRLKDDIRANVGDGIGGVLIALADKFKLNLTKINNWAGGIIDIIGGLPGKVGDKLRRVTDTVLGWVNSIDRVLSGLHKIFNSIPANLGDAIGKVINIFKGGTDAVITNLEGLKVSTADFSQGIGDLMKFASQESQASFNAISNSANNSSKEVDKAARAVVASIAAVATFAATRNQGKFAGVLGGAAAGAQIGSLFGPVRTIVGAGAGAILGLFGSGKSSAQKRAEEEAKQRAALDMQRAAADIMTAQMEGLKKGLELLQGLQGFAEVPRKAIKRFFNQIEMILTLFAEMAAKFKAESIEKSKAVAEIMSGGFSALLSGADLINSIKSVATITDQNIADFVATTMKIVTKWSEAASKIELQTAKFTGKIADKLTTSFEFLKIVPEVIKGFAESVKVDDSVLDSVFATAEKIIVKMKALSEAQRGLELNKAGSSAGIFSTIFEANKSMFELFKGLSEYKPLENSILDTITNDLKKLLAWGDSLIVLGESGLAKFETLGDVIARMAAAMRSATAGISTLAGGASATSGITASIQRQDGAGYLRTGGTTVAASTSTTVIHQSFQITLSLRDLEELATAPDRLQRLERLMNEARSRTGATAQAYQGA